MVELDVRHFVYFLFYFIFWMSGVNLNSQFSASTKSFLSKYQVDFLYPLLFDLCLIMCCLPLLCCILLLSPHLFTFFEPGLSQTEMWNHLSIIEAGPCYLALIFVAYSWLNYLGTNKFIRLLTYEKVVQHINLEIVKLTNHLEIQVHIMYNICVSQIQ